LLEFPGNFDDSGKTTLQRSLRRMAVKSICSIFCAATRPLHDHATIGDRRESARRFLQSGHDLWRSLRASSGVSQAMPETNRQRSPRKMAAMSMCCSSYVETRLIPHPAMIAGGRCAAVRACLRCR
jgi:hypothetical protein